jgi:TonB-linked SusC/RagA family outer membrane protein
MRRFLTLFTVLMLSGLLAFAQTRVVTGKVTDADGNPVSFASVRIKGSNVGLSADANGAYSIKVKAGDVLVFSGAGLKAAELPVGSLTVVNAILEKGAVSELKEVVVTGAFGTKRAARSTASNVQNISGDQLNTVRQSNVNNALAGKVAGAQVRSQSAAKLGAETTVRLRGENGLLQSNSGKRGDDGGTAPGGAIYVVDGTIMPSNADINPDDIEDLTVLQGPSAAALFGPDGANGAIVINLKKAKKNARGLGIEINSAIQFDRVYIIPEYQNSYAGGATEDLIQYKYKAGDPIGWKALDGKFYHDYTDDASWGPRMSGQEYVPWYAWYGGHEDAFKTGRLVSQPTGRRDYWETGVTKTNNINLSKASDNMSFRLSYTNLDIKGITPTEFLKRHNLSVTSTVDLSAQLILGATINYMAQDRNTESDDGYSNQTTGSFGSWYHNNLDMNKMRELRGLKSPEGYLATWNFGVNPGSYNASNPGNFYKANYWYNFYTYFDNVKNTDRRDRISGDVSLTYKINNDLRVKATYRKNQLTTVNEQIYASDLEFSGNQVSFNPFQGNNKAAYGASNTFSDRQNYEGLITYGKKLKDFAINANAGFDILKTRFRRVNANTMDGLSAPGLYALANSKSPVNYGNTKEQFTRRGVFVRADFGFRNYLFVEGSYRRDYTSTEPQGNYIDSKSGGMSFVFSDLTKTALPFINYGKIRASIGQSLNTLDIYQLNAAYVINTLQWSGSSLTTVPNNLVDPGLRGATNLEKEIGLEMRFLKNRVGFNVTYWDRTNKDFPVNVSVPQQTGYSVVSRNAGEIAKKGWDVNIFLKPIQNKNFSWEINGSWGYIAKNEVVSIFPGIDRLTISSGAFSGSSSAYTVNEIGRPWGQMFGKGIKRLNGQPVLKADGLFEAVDNVNFGSVLPQYTGGVQNTVNLFKNFTLNVNIDFSYGGKFFSLSDFWGTFSGLTARTATLNDKGNSVRDKVEDGGGVRVDGVDATGKAVTYYVDAQTYFHQFRGANISENSVYDLTFVKLRELSFGYRLPVEKLGLGKYVRTAVFSVVSRNPLLIYTKAKGFDPSEISSVFGEDGQLPGTRSIGVNLKIGF